MPLVIIMARNTAVGSSAMCVAVSGETLPFPQLYNEEQAVGGPEARYIGSRVKSRKTIRLCVLED